MDPYKTLKNHIKQRKRYVLFLGTNACIGSGDHSTQEIIFGILRQFYGPRPNAEIQVLFETEHKRPLSFENVLDAIGTQKPDCKEVLAEFFTNMHPSEGYRHLAVLLKSDYFYPIILMTGFDRMLEEALMDDVFLDKKIKITTLVQEEIVSFPIEPQPNELIIVKLHGDISKPDSLKITNSETALLSNPCENFVIHLFEQYGFVVVGYRTKDVGIRNALERAKTSGKGLFWVSEAKSADLTDIDIHYLLNKHNSKNNVIFGSTFEEVFKALGLSLVKVQVRRKHALELDEAWTMLDKARSFGSERHIILEQMEKLVTKLLQSVTLEEVFALEEFIHYEFDRSGETYRLQQGVQFLEITIDEYSEYMEEVELAELEYSLLRELLNLFLSGNQIPGGRLAHLHSLISRGETLLQELPRKQNLLRAKCLIVLGEAVKELAMITEDPNVHVRLYQQARTHCENAIELVQNIDMPEARYLLGLAYRHMAVTFEEEGDLCSEKSARKDKYETWRKYSSMAIETLEEVSEETSRSYALMNLASSYTRLCEFEVNDWQKRQLLDSGNKNLQEAIHLLRKVHEHRGIGWAYIHLCENTRQR